MLYIFETTMFTTKKIAVPAKEYLNQLFQIKPDFQRFNQKNDIFNRSLWDDKIDPKSFYISYDITNFKPKKSRGFDHWDFALRNASWHLTDVVGDLKLPDEGRVEGFTDYYTLQTQGPPQKITLPSIEETSQKIKKVATILGAGMVGICELDERWVYSHNFSRKTQQAKPLNLPEKITHVIVLILPMNYELSKTIPSALGGATTGLGYATSLNCATALAQFITNLGYEAIASLNDTAQNVPLAIQAGLGEYGRNGLLITPKYGPNVRIAKVFTDLPLTPDQPIDFGVRKFCQICRKCANACPVKAIAKEAPTEKPPNISSHSMVKKWTVNAEKCFKFWVGMNTDCAICIRVCPYHKDYSKWWHRLGIRLANSPFRKIMLWLDSVLKFGKRKPASWWWKDV